jgi:hypothetical protein
MYDERRRYTMPSSVARHRDERKEDLTVDLGNLEPGTEPVVLTARDLEVFLAEWDNPGKPHPRLEEAARRYQNRRQPDAG